MFDYKSVSAEMMEPNSEEFRSKINPEPTLQAPLTNIYRQKAK